MSELEMRRRQAEEEQDKIRSLRMELTASQRRKKRRGETGGETGEDPEGSQRRGAGDSAKGKGRGGREHSGDSEGHPRGCPCGYADAGRKPQPAA